MFFNDPAADSTFECAEAILALASKETDSVPMSKAREKAVCNTLARVKLYRDEGIRNDLVHIVFVKRMELIQKAMTVKELHSIMNEPRPQYDGNAIYTSAYCVPEEEMILWSITSLRAGGPLIDAASKRYLTLFRETFGTDPTDPDFDKHQVNRSNLTNQISKEI